MTARSDASFSVWARRSTGVRHGRLDLLFGECGDYKWWQICHVKFSPVCEIYMAILLPIRTKGMPKITKRRYGLEEPSGSVDPILAARQSLSSDATKSP